jgi:hypothetical protein
MGAELLPDCPMEWLFTVRTPPIPDRPLVPRYRSSEKAQVFGQLDGIALSGGAGGMHLMPLGRVV